MNAKKIVFRKRILHSRIKKGMNYIDTIKNFQAIHRRCIGNRHRWSNLRPMYQCIDSSFQPCLGCQDHPGYLKQLCLHGRLNDLCKLPYYRFFAAMLRAMLFYMVVSLVTWLALWPSDTHSALWPLAARVRAPQLSLQLQSSQPEKSMLCMS